MLSNGVILTDSNCSVKAIVSNFSTISLIIFIEYGLFFILEKYFSK